MSLPERTSRLLDEAYQSVGLEVIPIILEITAKYEGVTGQALMEGSIDELQADALRLTSLNIHLGTLAGILDGDALSAENLRKFKDAEVYLQEKDLDGGTVEELKRKAEMGIASYRMGEVQALKKAKILRQTVSSVSEMVNMLKKITERLMWQGPSSNM